MLEIQGVQQHYDWGGRCYIPMLLDLPEASAQPVAELWFGDHPSGDARIAGDHAFSAWLKDSPVERLGQDSVARFGQRLPYLLKVLDVRQPLSIQVHPSLKQAKQGFASERVQDLPAEQCNYKDDNHKPELMLALSDFWLLHGLKRPEQLALIFDDNPSLKRLESVWQHTDNAGLVQHCFSLNADELAEVLEPIIERHLASYLARELPKSSPYFWLCRAYLRAQQSGQGLEAGLLMVLFLNLVYVAPGQVIFQDAGIPHAYLEGQNIELMANSDNVLRAGLTSKRVDVNELLKVADFSAAEATPIEPIELADGGLDFPVPVDDFQLIAYQLEPGQQLVLEAAESGSVWFLLSGELSLQQQSKLWREGEAYYQLPGEKSLVSAHSCCKLYRAKAKTE
ncbi:mannose-6-phosphate isomerase, class I [Aliagarivorans taiwanensis]|uniref:mannose-6-phosphate isomerase, class I n=1 Tax=Aliagarivorans taiwanensis TaxID=561966 RepID=UPI00042337BE|nr:mannose-6-phosphate isomerase, class I [Aliagarivorans taiwanensis]